MAIFRGEVYFVQLGPTIGREIDAKRRPAVVVSTNVINSKPLVVVVIPGTSRSSARLAHRNEVEVEPSSTNGLSAPTLFQCHQIKALDHSRFDQPPVGVLSSRELDALERSIKSTLGLP
jgi:mRNA interferase MazF